MNCGEIMNGDAPRRKVALITGITGQVHGIIRRSSSFNTGRVNHIYEKNKALKDIISKVSFELSEYTGEVVAIGTLRMLDAIRTCKLENKVKFYQASSSELYGKVAEVPQSEKTPFHPRSPYSVAKLYAFWIVVNYRESYGMFACNGILFNHESPRRGETFVTRKISRAVVRIKKGLQDVLELGNLNAERDWGFAGDYVKAMWLMLQRDTPEDFVIASGEKHSVREFTSLAFEHAGIHIVWKGTGIDEVGIDSATGKDELLGDCTRAKEVLKWEPTCGFKDLVKLMVDEDMKLLESGLTPI
ncbi:unnamed protein product [Trichobilharzia regenti]|nr:unnamed protein product [Trichobilharzia regenti]